MATRTRAKVGPEVFAAAHAFAVDILAERATSKQAMDGLSERFSIAPRTALGYFGCYVAMRRGTAFFHTVQADGWRYMLEKIAIEGSGPLMRALETFMRHIVYLRGKTGSREPGLQRVHEEFVARLKNNVQFDVVSIALEEEVQRSLHDTAEIRAQRLREAAKKPEAQVVLARVFRRNADVIAEVLLRAVGKCEGCGEIAPFSRPNGQPFLEVHHVVRLADGGDDTIENAIALCPNCHRERHYGAKYVQLE